ncbi:hypothetical protein, partial [Burkholderia pyrrocinia]|uniref:hypothetical protein n=1 Tax=Burkholderia pyrrocinia TaxID=60550 RepID=UPI001A9E65EE
ISWLFCGVSTSSFGLLMAVMSFDAEKKEGLPRRQARGARCAVPAGSPASRCHSTRDFMVTPLNQID